jgi:hypothetical protein
MTDFTLCCDCDWTHENEDFSVHDCKGFPIKKGQGCTEGKPKPKMLSINGVEFPAPLTINDKEAKYVLELRVRKFNESAFSSITCIYHKNEQDAQAHLDALVKASGGE